MYLHIEMVDGQSHRDHSVKSLQKVTLLVSDVALTACDNQIVWEIV